MHLAICEDDMSMMESLEEMTMKWAREREVVITIRKYKNAESFLGSWPPSYPYDTVILDIIMGLTNGMELAADIRKSDNLVNIIFASGATDYTANGFKVNALRYLQKPFSKEELFEALDEASLRAKTRETASIVLELPGETIRVSANEITHISMVGNRHYVIVRTIDGREYYFRGTMIELMDKIPDEAKHYFYMCHKSHIVNLMYVHMIFKYQAVLVGKDQKNADISVRAYPGFNKAFIDFHDKGEDNA